MSVVDFVVSLKADVERESTAWSVVVSEFVVANFSGVVVGDFSS